MADPLDGYSIDWIGSPNYQAGRALPIDNICVHHCAGFSLPDATFANPARQASSTYAVHGKTIHQYVSEDDTSWCNGNWWANTSGITLELVNSTGDPDWAIAEDTFDTAARLCADILKRHGLGDLYYNGSQDGSTLYRHCDIGNLPTGCPGPWFKDNTDRFCQLTNQYLHGTAPSTNTSYRDLWTYSPNGTDAQVFTITEKDGAYTIASILPTKWCLDVSNGKYSSGNTVWCYKPNGTVAQQWTLEQVKDGLTNSFYIHPKSAPNLALDVRNGSKDPMTGLWLYPNNKTPAQKFTLIPVGTNTYRIASCISGLLLDVKGGERGIV